MSLLDHLWDDTVAGPQPEHGLGKLRKFHTFSSSQNSTKELEVGNGKSYGDDLKEEAMKVTRRIMIIKPAQGNGSPPISPAGSSTPPVSPFSGGGRGESISRFRRRSMSDVFERRGSGGPRSPTSAYDV
ncbi:hypothetical protein IFM89_018334 [Coptis chinensis]|uniref:Dormancy-associated protein homolog 3 n=1 Tax=Coptis chinensis TaxID=261450 RepID=A0A835MBT7_9MAGN|nr:hypothetical protein IFM89_018334 [Coptis chinensis]